MFDLFRLIMLRPPEMSAESDALLVQPDSEFLTRLRNARNGDAPFSEMRKIADEFISSDAFVKTPSSIERSPALESFYNHLQERLSQNAAISLDELNQLILNSFNAAAVDLTNVLQPDKRRLYDSLIAIKIGVWQPNSNFSHLSRYIRLIALIELVAFSDQTLAQENAVRRKLERDIVLPSDLFPLPSPAQSGEQNGDATDTEAQKREELLKKHEHLQTAYRLLTQLEPEDISFNLSQISPSIEEPPAEFTETEKILRAQAGRLARVEIDRLGNENLTLQDKLTSWHQVQDFVANERIASLDGAVTPLSQTAASSVAKLHLKPAAIERFSEEIKTTLADLNVTLDTTSLPIAAERIKAELTQITPQVVTALQSKVANTITTANIVPIGSQFFPKPELARQPIPPEPPKPVPMLPATHGVVKPVGVGDLLVVKQQLIGYETGEVAHIENILKGEIQKREVRRSETTEESTLTEQESIKEEERDQQSTERFEMQRESQNILALDGQVRGGSLKSPSYGPVVEFETNDQTQIRGAQQLSERTATNYSQDVTNRAVSRVTERVRTQVMRRVVRQFEDRTEHTYDNAKDGAAHVVGIYQWVNKIYQAQVYNYGKRLFYDLVVPEPAVFLLQAFAQNQVEGRGLVKPALFTVPLKDGTERPLQPDDITDTTYAYYVAKYQATGVKAPPEPYIIVSKILTGASEPKPQSLELTVPEGYEPAMTSIFTWLGKSTSAFGEIKRFLNIEISKGECWYAQLGCRRKDSSYKQWQLNTYEAILRAYHQQMADYEERLANLQAAFRIGALGQSSEQKRILERTELKKACITLFTYQQFGFSAIESPKDKANLLYPQLDLANAELLGRYIRFFEQAFEWEQMMYNFYPYFWGRKDQWLQKVMFDDRDPQFTEFLKAGAARTLVSVRPGFEKAIIHFMETGEIWEGGNLPEINSSTYLPLLEELKTQEKTATNPLPYGEPWKIKLPTTLVRLRDDSKLPKWKQENGDWVVDE